MASTFAEVRSHVPTPVVQAAMLQARRDGSRRRRLVRRRLVRGPRQGRLLLHRAGGGHAGRVVRRSARAAAHRHPDDLLRCGAHAVLRDDRRATHAEGGGGGPTTAPIAVVYDPVLTLSTPAAVSAETGMNALAHCVEVAYSPHRTPEAEAIALAGARRIVDALPRVVDDPDDVDARTDAARRGGAGRTVPAERVRWACTTVWRSSSAGAPASPTGWRTR